MNITKRKYSDIKSLAAAFASGELKHDEWTLVVDNDDASLIYTGPVPTELSAAQADSFRERKNGEANLWFKGSGYSDLVDALNAAGIPAEWC